MHSMFLFHLRPCTVTGDHTGFVSASRVHGEAHDGQIPTHPDRKTLNSDNNIKTHMEKHFLYLLCFYVRTEHSVTSLMKSCKHCKVRMQLTNLLQGSTWRILLVSTLTCGLEACMSTVTVYIPPLLLQAGMEQRYMTMVLGKFSILAQQDVLISCTASRCHSLLALLCTHQWNQLTCFFSLAAMAPVLGMIFIPMIGSASDSHQSRFGRRRPFIWMLSLGILLGLQIMPQARRLAVLMSPQHHRWLEAAMQAAGVNLLNFCGEVSLGITS